MAFEALGFECGLLVTYMKELLCMVCGNLIYDQISYNWFKIDQDHHISEMEIYMYVDIYKGSYGLFLKVHISIVQIAESYFGNKRG